MEHPLKNPCKIYRFETIVISNPGTSYCIEKNYVRTAEIYYLGNEKGLFKYHILIVDFDFSNDDNAMGKLLKQISYLFDELELTVDEAGNIIEVDNISFLRSRWTEIADELTKTHQGEAIDNYFNQVSSLLDNQERLIGFLGGYNMFGLLFNGLLQSLDDKRKRLSPDGFTEIMTPVKEGDKMMLTISPENLDGTDIDHFKGVLMFRKGHYEEGFAEVKKDNTHLKHSLLWIG